MQTESDHPLAGCGDKQVPAATEAAAGAHMSAGVEHLRSHEIHQRGCLPHELQPAGSKGDQVREGASSEGSAVTHCVQRTAQSQELCVKV